MFSLIAIGLAVNLAGFVWMPFPAVAIRLLSLTPEQLAAKITWPNYFDCS
jgi:hypothetical protein